jgi:hypothetical protein
MPWMLPRLAAVLVAAAALAPARSAAAGECRVVHVDLQPTAKLQIVAWIEDAQGNYVDTIFLTDAVGRRGIGNRPGRFDFNSGPRWPYGRRVTTFPIWSHRHGQTFPMLVFQNVDDNNLSHPLAQSSQEVFFCRPLRDGEVGWDTGTCASPAVFTDKGKFDPVRTSPYPPREDITRVAGVDDSAVDMFEQMNGFDAVSTATPPADQLYSLSWPIPAAMGSGDYVLWVEVAKEFDHNATYNTTAYPSPAVPWSEYGLPYRGQPSIVYKVPFTVGVDASRALTMAYTGYGDPDGVDGNVRGPDATITTNMPGSGAARLALVTDGAETFRLRVVARPEQDGTNPAAPADLHEVEVGESTALVSFTAPADDGGVKVAGYEVRYRAGEPITEANFADSSPIAQAVVPEQPGTEQDIELTSLLPATEYYLGIRAYDNCRNTSTLTTLRFVTAEKASTDVDACFVATAAYGSLLANDVVPLRTIRDRALRQSVLGELFVESYYSIGPAFAAAIAPSEDLRQAARAGLGPLVELARTIKLEPPAR